MVLCGHTHGSGEAPILSNLRVLTAGPSTASRASSVCWKSIEGGNYRLYEGRFEARYRVPSARTGRPSRVSLTAAKVIGIVPRAQRANRPRRVSPGIRSPRPMTRAPWAVATRLWVRKLMSGKMAGG